MLASAGGPIHTPPPACRRARRAAGGARAEAQRAARPAEPRRAARERAYKSGAATSRRCPTRCWRRGYEELSPIASGAFDGVRAADGAARRWRSRRSSASRSRRWRPRRTGQRAPRARWLQPSAHPAIANVIEVLEAEKTTHVALEYAPAARPPPAAEVVVQGAGRARRGDGDRPGRSALRHQAAAAPPPKAKLEMSSSSTARQRQPATSASPSLQQRPPPQDRVRHASVHGARDGRADPGGTYAGLPVDMWSLGALADEALHAAFRGSSMEQWMRVLRADHERLGKELSERARALLAALLVPDPAARATAAATLDHPFIPADIGIDLPELPALGRRGSRRGGRTAPQQRPGARARAASRVAAAGHRRVGVRDRVAGQRDGEGAAKPAVPTAPPSPAEYSMRSPVLGMCIQGAVRGSNYLFVRRVAHARQAERVAVVGGPKTIRGSGIRGAPSRALPRRRRADRAPRARSG